MSPLDTLPDAPETDKKLGVDTEGLKTKQTLGSTSRKTRRDVELLLDQTDLSKRSRAA